MKKIIVVIVVILILFIILALGIGGNYLYNLAVNPNILKDRVFNSPKNNLEPRKSSEKKKDWLENESGYTDVYIRSDDGFKLHNYKIINKYSSKKWVIIVHGYISKGVNMASYAENFYDMGYNVMIPDLRAHGESEGYYIGMGWDDRNDIINLIE